MSNYWDGIQNNPYSAGSQLAAMMQNANINPYQAALATNQDWLARIMISEADWLRQKADASDLFDAQMASDLIRKVAVNQIRASQKAPESRIEESYAKATEAHQNIREILRRRQPKTLWQRFVRWLSGQKQAERALEFVAENIAVAANEWHKSSRMWKGWVQRAMT